MRADRPWCYRHGSGACYCGGMEWTETHTYEGPELVNVDWERWRAPTRAATEGAQVTKRQREVLEIMAAHPDDDVGELVYEKGHGWLGDERVAPRTVFALLRLMAISLDSTSRVGGVERYTINETGRHLAFNVAVNIREKWYGRSRETTHSIPEKAPRRGEDV